MADSGWGKSTLSRYITDKLSASWLVYIIDTDYEFENESRKNVIILSPDFDYAGDIKYLSSIIDRLREKSNFVLVITDLDKYFEDASVLVHGSKGLKDLYGTGRHQRVLPIIEAKQPRYIPSKVFSNSNLFYIGSFNEVEDTRRLKNYASVNELQALNPHEFIEVDRWARTKRKVKIVDNQLKYID